MQLTRRDALAALVATGAGIASGCLDGRLGERQGGADTLASLTAVAAVLYPSAVEGHEAFVETYVVGRIADREEYYAGVRETVAALDDRSREWFDAPLADLPPADREALLRQVGADTVEPDPAGLLPGRTRHYVVDELLYAFYATPTGGRLAGIENPVGYPGGIDSYQRARMPGGDGGWSQGRSAGSAGDSEGDDD